MALHYITIVAPQGAWGGENSDWPADILMPGQLSATESVAHEGPEIVRRPGQFREPDAVTSAGLNVVAGFAANYSTGQKVIVQGSNGRFYQTSAGMTSFAAMSTSAFWAPATFAQLGDIAAICTVSGTMLGTSGTDGVFDLDAGLTGVSAAPAAQFVISYKNRLYAAGQTTSADEVKFTAIGTVTGLPVVTDWYSTNNAGNRLFGQGEGFRLIGLAADRDQWYAFKRNRTLMVTGNTPQSFITAESDREWGAYHRSIANVGRGLVGANEDGLAAIVNGKVEPLLPERMLKWWQTLDLNQISGWSGAWSPYYQQYRLMVTSGGVNSLLVGVVLPNKPIGWYRAAIPAQCLFTRLRAGNRVDFYRGGNADGYLYRMDQGTQDASASFNSFFETAIYDNGKPWEDKQFKRAWVFGRTRGAQQVSCTFRVHGEQAQPTRITGYKLLPLATTVGDIKRQSFHLDGQWGWGVSVRVDFSTVSAGSVHKIVVEYDDGRKGTAVY